MANLPPVGLVDCYQKKVLHGITEINIKMQILPPLALAAYLSDVQPLLIVRIKEVRAYMELLSVTPDKAEDLASMRVIENDLRRIIKLVENLHEKLRQKRTAAQIPVPSTKLRPEPRGPCGLLASTKIDIIESEEISPQKENGEEKSEKSPTKSILRPPREKFPDGPLAIRKGTGKVKAIKEELGLK